jgi:gluconolactonase
VSNTSHDALPGYLKPGVAPVCIAAGFRFLEGPIWHPRRQALIFSDIQASTTLQWSAEAGVLVLRHPSWMANGLGLDADLNLIACEHESSALTRIYPDGRREVLATHFKSLQLNSPNDLVVHSSGAIYFTDPTYGRKDFVGVARPCELPFRGVFRWTAGCSEPELMVPESSFVEPNGLTFSPDESLLYVNDSEAARILVYDIAADGRLVNERLFADGLLIDGITGNPDGMKCDIDGNIWCTGPGGLWVYAPDGSLIGKIATPEFITNLHWGGADYSSLFLCGITSLYRLDTLTHGRAEPFMSAC